MAPFGRHAGGSFARAVRALIRAQLEAVDSWERFLGTRVAVDPLALVDEPTRRRLDALPAMVRVRGDAVPLDYELADGAGIARARLREGQARRLRAGDLPPLDRPLRFAIVRGRHEPILADTIEELQAALKRAPRAGPEEDEDGRPRHGRRPSTGAWRLPGTPRCRSATAIGVAVAECVEAPFEHGDAPLCTRAGAARHEGSGVCACLPGAGARSLAEPLIYFVVASPVTS